MRRLVKFAHSRALASNAKSLISQNRASLTRINSAISKTNFPELLQDSHILAFSSRSLEDYFLLTIGGPYNVGKSSLINSLVGFNLVKTGVTPTTAQINYIRNGPIQEVIETSTETITKVPAPWLANISIIDTPGIDSIFEEHEQKTKEFIKLSDLVFFLTSSAQAFTRTEQTFLDYCHANKKPVVILITKKELLTPDELEEVKEFLTKHFSARFKYAPEIIAISNKQDYDKSGIPEIKYYIQTKLDDTNRVKIKLDNTSNTALMLIAKYANLCQQECNILATNLEQVDKISKYAIEYAEEMNKYLELNYAQLDTIINQMREKASLMLDENVSLANFTILFNRTSFTDKFKKEVIEASHELLKRKIFYIVDYSNTRNKKFIDQVRVDLQHQYESLKSFSYDAPRNTEIVDKSISEVYDKIKSVNTFADEIAGTMLNTILVELGAVFGFGAIATFVPAGLLPFDPVFVPIAGAITILGGLTMLPIKKNAIKASLTRKTGEAGKKLNEILDAYFQEEMTRNTSQINALISPHRSLLETKLKQLKSITHDLDSEKKLLDALVLDISKIS